MISSELSAVGSKIGVLVSPERRTGHFDIRYYRAAFLEALVTQLPPRGDRIGTVDARVYRTLTEDGVEIAVTRLTGSADPGVPVILVHGTFCQRSFWVSPKGIGLGPFLRDRGFDVWIVELRGHGRSPKTLRYRTWTAEDMMRFDLPAVQALVREESGQRAHWVGHSWGGMAIVGSLAGGWLDEAEARCAAVLGANITAGDEWLRRWWPRAGAWLLMTALGRVPARLLRMGPEDEPRGYLLDFYGWKGPAPNWVTREGASYWAGVCRIQLPLLAFAAADDHNDPEPGCRALFDAVGSEDKEYVLLGEAQGFSRDYEHIEMIIGQAAQDEVWPRIAAWLELH